ncbi:FAD/NAD-P-binding domain-containing protein [Irpex rosettiformis]|uniref:FAD/NAD-P-binding domain-containing protein n=1 Tax=Irpex rosettiformis TaxID=378272 RepID=A0ACB8U010_9APHY|nr:FAD/NAD-P-binding domain-containing protein [Irpex rosettiformis]
MLMTLSRIVRLPKVISGFLINLGLRSRVLALTLPNTPAPICIVGAGPSGLAIAHELEAKDYATVLFEKQPTVGGKCQSFYDQPDGTLYHPLGALIFTNQTWVNTLPIIEASGLPLSPGPNVTSGFIYGAGFTASLVVPVPPVTDAQKALLASEFQRYAAFWTANFAPKYTALRYTNGVPKEFSVPITQWLQSQGFKALPQVMELGMVPFGYGDIKQTPAIYALQYFTPDVLGAFLGVVPSYNVDFHQVMVHYAASVQGEIHLNAPVIAIDRSGETPVITYSQGGSSFNQHCAKVVFAFPPTLENLRAINMPLTSQEAEVFSKVGITAYWASAVETKLDFPKPYYQMPLEPLNTPVAFIRIFNESPITTAWSWGAIGSNPPLELVTDLLVDTISQVQVGLGLESPIIGQDAVKDIRKWDYFPHFGSADLAAGVYAEYNSLQGQQNTYFSSGLNGFELVEFAIRAGKDLVATFF